jgi:hypothetical protein
MSWLEKGKYFVQARIIMTRAIKRLIQTAKQSLEEEEDAEDSDHIRLLCCQRIADSIGFILRSVEAFQDCSFDLP